MPVTAKLDPAADDGKVYQVVIDYELHYSVWPVVSVESGRCLRARRAPSRGSWQPGRLCHCSCCPPPQKSVEKILCRGWKKIGISGTKPKCLSWIDANWTDTDDRTEREKRREKSGVEPYYKVRRCRPTGTPAAPLRVAHSPLRPLTLFRTTSTRTPSHANV